MSPPATLQGGVHNRTPPIPTMKLTNETPPCYCPTSPLRDITKVDHTTAGLEALTRGRGLFRGSRLVSWEGDLPLLEDGVHMFSWSNLERFKGVLPSLYEAGDMFYECRKLIEFASDMPRLKYGAHMFHMSQSLHRFDSDLASLQDGEMMFYWCRSLQKLRINLPSLVKADSMFNKCDSLGSFDIPTPRLRNAEWMFYGCRSLRTFRGDLGSLARGRGMFSGCKLNVDSVYHIADCIRTAEERGEIGIGVAEDVDWNDLSPALAELDSKNWSVSLSRCTYPADKSN